MRHLVSFTFFLILSVIIYLFFHLGAYKDVKFELYNPTQPIFLVYKNHIGAYHKIVPTIEEVEKWVKTQNEGCNQSFGEFIDNPQVVEQSRLRSLGGCVVSKVFNNNLPEGFYFKELAPQTFLKAIFEGSPAIGPYKVYGKASEWIEKNGYVLNGSTFEFYTIHSNTAMTTEYLFSIKNKY